MKKLLLSAAAAFTAVCLCACGGPFKSEPTPVPEINPLELVSAEDVYEAINYAYAPILEGNAYTRDGNKSEAYYRSETAGQGDPVIITVTQYTESVSKETVWYEYDNDRIKRPSAEMISDLGEDAFIAFPSIYVYDRGCYIKITAGSGDTEEQRNMLLSLAQTAVARLETVMPSE